MTEADASHQQSTWVGSIQAFPEDEWALSKSSPRPSWKTGSEWVLEQEAWGLWETGPSLCLPLSLCRGPGDPAVFVEGPRRLSVRPEELGLEATSV